MDPDLAVGCSLVVVFWCTVAVYPRSFIMKRSRLLACLLLASALAVCQLGFFNLKARGTQLGSVEALCRNLLCSFRSVFRRLRWLGGTSSQKTGACNAVIVIVMSLGACGCSIRLFGLSVT